MGISVKLSRYTQNDKSSWDSLVAKTSPGLVLHYRDYMEYHSELFEDFSICFWDQNSLLAVAPGTRNKDEWISHQGLTFGGLILPSENITEMMRYIQMLNKFLLKEDFKKSTIILASNSFYPNGNTEWIYAFNQAGYVASENHLNQFIHKSSNLPKKKLTNARAAFRKGITFSIDLSNLPPLYNLIEENLVSKYERKPIHTLAEIELLCKRFPDLISTYTTNFEKKVVAGAIVFQSFNSLHIQYLATNDLGKQIRAQDYLIKEILDIAKAKCKNLSFGKSTSGDNAALNSSLYNFKAEYGTNPESIFTLTCKLG